MVPVVLPIMLFLGNMTTLNILGLLNMRPLLGSYLAIGLGLIFHLLHALLTLFKARRFIRRQPSGLHALIDSLLLLDLALVDTRRRGGIFCRRGLSVDRQGQGGQNGNQQRGGAIHLHLLEFVWDIPMPRITPAE